jgi:DNA invertase Pin-like site-specific DNA recombinase
MIIGYSRVSTIDQNLERQKIQLNEFGCTYIVDEKESGIKERPKLNDLLSKLRFEDVLVVSEFSRVSRSLVDLIRILEELKEKDAYFVSLKEGIDTRKNDGAMANFLINIMGSVAQLEIQLLKERQKEGISIARKNNKYLGRKPKYTFDNPQVMHAFELVESGKYADGEVIRMTGISRATFYRLKKGRKKEIENL